jgi:hypothetical protein
VLCTLISLLCTLVNVLCTLVGVLFTLAGEGFPLLNPSTNLLCHVELIFHFIMSRLKPIALSNFVPLPIENPNNVAPTWTPVGVAISAPSGTIPGFPMAAPALLVSVPELKHMLRSTPYMISAGFSYQPPPPTPPKPVIDPAAILCLLVISI